MTLRSLVWVLSALLAWTPATALGERSSTFGEYKVHYNAFATTLLNPEVARAYRITRSAHRALVTVSVQRKLMETTGQSVPAQISATATNLHGQAREVVMREIREQGAIYYIGELRVSNEELLRFQIQVHPEGELEAHSVVFEQQFFTR